MDTDVGGLTYIEVGAASGVGAGADGFWICSVGVGTGVDLGA